MLLLDNAETVICLLYSAEQSRLLEPSSSILMARIAKSRFEIDWIMTLGSSKLSNRIKV